MTNKFDRIHTNTNKKYIIRNCPCYTLKGGYYDCWANQDTWCQNIIDCKLKQIVELAKGHTELCRNCEQQIKECECGDICNAYRLNKILQLLQIEEEE